MGNQWTPTAVDASSGLSAKALYLLTCWLQVVQWTLPWIDRLDWTWSTLKAALWHAVLGGPRAPPLGPSHAVVVTGASTGIGAAVAQDLADRGVTVFAGVRQDKDLARLRQLHHPRLVPIMLDVSDEASIARALGAVTDWIASHDPTVRLGAIINNAGIPENSAFECASRADAERVFAVNVFGAADVTRAFLPMLREAGGRIVLISSAAATLTPPLAGVYGGSKRAVEAIFEALRAEVASEGIAVSIIRPGVVATPIWSKMNFRTSLATPTVSPQVTRVKNAMVVVGISTEHVVRAVSHALTATFPLLCYHVGMDARMMLAWSTFPRLCDWAGARLYLPKPKPARLKE